MLVVIIFNVLWLTFSKTLTYSHFEISFTKVCKILYNLIAEIIYLLLNNKITIPRFLETIFNVNRSDSVIFLIIVKLDNWLDMFLNLISI